MENLNSLKLISLNLEGHKHLDLQVPFFLAQFPDVLCLQEVFEVDFEYLRSELGMEGGFAPMCLHEDENGEFKPFGVAILTRLPIRSIQPHYYFGDPAVMYEYVSGSKNSQEELNKVLLHIILSGPHGSEFSVGTTHFTWTPDGEANDRQREDLWALFKILDGIPEFVLCGDFNAPRGGEIFAALAKKYADNIPAQYTTSIDGNIHARVRYPTWLTGCSLRRAIRCAMCVCRTA